MIDEEHAKWILQARKIARADLEEQYQQAFGPVLNIADIASWKMLAWLGNSYVDPNPRKPEAEHNPDTGINLPDPPPTTD